MQITELNKSVICLQGQNNSISHTIKIPGLSLGFMKHTCALKHIPDVLLGKGYILIH